LNIGRLQRDDDAPTIGRPGSSSSGSTDPPSATGSGVYLVLVEVGDLPSISRASGLLAHLPHLVTIGGKMGLSTRAEGDRNAGETLPRTSPSASSNTQLPAVDGGSRSAWMMSTPAETSVESGARSAPS